MVSPPSAPNLRSVANKQTNRKRHQRSRDNAATVLGRMRREHLTLHCEHDNRRGRLAWHLSDGTEVSDPPAHELIRHPNIERAGDALPFGKGDGTPCPGAMICSGQRLPQAPEVAAQRRAAQRAWRERQCARKAANLAAALDDAAGKRNAMSRAKSGL